MTSTTMTRPAPATAPDFAGIPFGRLLRVEWGKATDTRAARWLLALVAASTVGLMLVPLLAPGSIDQTYMSYLGFAAIGLTVLLPVVSILTLTSEWSQHTALTTFTQEPRRTRVINAKVAVSLLLAAGAAVFGGLVTAAGLAVAAASGRALDMDLNAGVVVGYLLFVLLNVLTGMAFGALLHNSAAAIVLYFALPTAFGLLGQVLKSVGQWVDSSTTFDWLRQGEWSGHTPQILVSATIWLVIPLAAGLVRTARREIN
jgi:ABC-2 type transport system permease protein